MTSDAERDTAAALYEIYSRAFSVLCEADLVLSKAPDTPWLKELAEAHHELAFAVMPRMMRYRIFGRYPEVDTDRPEGPPDTLLDAEGQGFVDGLSPTQILRIDEALLSDCIESGRKVARIIGTAFNFLKHEIPDAPLGLYSRRVQALVAAGKLESRGNLDYMRFSEVRLARDPLDAVVDAALVVDAGVLDALTAFRDGQKRTDLVDAEPDDPSLELSPNLDRLADLLLQRLSANPSKRWVMKQFQQSLVPVVHSDKEGRKRFGDELTNIMRMLGIDDDDGLLDFYLDWC